MLKPELKKRASKWKAEGGFFMKAALCFMGCVLFLSGSSHACFVVGDLNGDCQVGMDDLLVMAAQWMAPSSCGNEAGLVAHWKLDESSGSIAIDSSASGYDGTVFGASWNPSGGRLGGALQFDGTNDYMFRNGYQGITGSNPRTCAAWIKTDRPSGEIMSWGDRDVDAGRWVMWVDQAGVLRVDVGGGYIFGTTVLTDDLWHHVAVTSGGSATDQIVLYVDGMIETIGEIVSEPINTLPRATVKLGVFQLLYMEGSYFNGLIDDARIYNRALSLQEIWSIAKTATTDYACADMNLDQTVNLVDMAMMSQDWSNVNPIISINEFLADNESESPLDPGEILDGNGESSDWIELHNNSEMTIELGQWYLTDDVDLKAKWQFPASTVLQPGEYLIVFASGKTQAENPGNYPYVDSAGFLHTNFQLSKDGEYLGLIAADGTTPVHEYNQFDVGGQYGYPEQAAAISYGYYYDGARYFSVPTPGTDNVRSPFEDVVEKPDVNINGGCYIDAVDVTLNCGTPGAFIQYTTDGTAPSLTNGIQYTGPIAVSSTTKLIANAFKPGFQPSDARIETYIFVDPAVSPSNTNLPIVVVDTLGAGIVDDAVNKPWTQCIAVIVDVDAVTGRAYITGPEHFNGLGQIRYRGESTYGTKRHFRVETLDEYGLDKKVPLLDMPEESDWVLSNDQLDYTMMKKGLAYKWFRDMGHYAPRQRYVELYLNQDGGKITSSDYLGLFMLRENIKRDDYRVDIARLDASHNLEPKVSGGYIIKSDKYDAGDTLLADGVSPDYLEWSPYGIQVTGAGKPILAEPDALVVTQPQIDWIAGYLNTISSVLWQNTSSAYYPGPQAKYTDYLDLVSWIDHGILEQVCADSDAFWGSYFTHKDRDGKHFSGPPWDYDRGFHNNGSSYDQPYNVWKANGGIFGKWHQKLQEDVEYKMLLADRWFEHREVVLNTALTMEYIDQTKALISESRLERPEKQYPKPFDEEIQLFKTWITNRLNWLDGEIAGTFAQKPPVFNPVGGYVNPGSSLEISKPSGASGDIYYTINGQDPRLEGGTINPDALLFTAAGGSTIESLITMSSVWKYLYDGSDQGTAWRAVGFDDSSWGSGPGQLGFGDGDETTDIGPRVNARRTAYFRHKFTVFNISEITALVIDLVYDDGAVVYLNNQEVGRIHMSGTISYDTLSDGSGGDNATTVFSGINPSVLVEGDNILAVEVHQDKDNSSDISFDLGLEASRITRPSQIGFEKSICVKARILDGSNWSAMNTEIYAVGPVLENLRISELMYHPADPNTEFIELQNIGADAINLNLVHFTDGVDFTFGDYTLAAGGYVLVVENQTDFEAKYGTGLPIAGQYTGALDNGGEEIVLRDAVGTKIHDFDYKDGWYELTDGLGHSLTMVDPASADPNLWDTQSGWRSSLYMGGTPGQASETVLPAGSIVINELLAHSHDTDPDWIELYNTTGQDIDLGGWFLSDDDSDLDTIRKYEIPENTMIEALGYLVLVENTSFGDPSLPAGQGFGLSEAGETLFVYSGQNGQITGCYQTQQQFDASDTDVTLGRYEKPELSDGYDFARMENPTDGLPNSAPLIPSIVITEIHYNPSTGADDEYVELCNRSGSPVTLMTQASAETAPGIFTTESIPWRLEGTGFEFPANVTINPGRYILVAKDPSRYTSAPCDVYGPYDGKLDNGGEELAIQIPGDQEYGKERYWIPIEKVKYDDTAPWPTNPDGSGDSLHRINVNTYGRDYSNWNAAPPTPGI
jgi:hypothetical protein